MTRLRNLALGGLTALAIGGVASTAFAVEPVDFQNRLNGATVGLPLGAAPPPGLYTGLETAYLGWDGQAYGNQGAAHINAIAQAVPLLWVPGWNFLGGSYSAAAVLAFYEAQALGNNIYNGGPGASAAGFYVFANPTFTPIDLSWNLGNGWFVSAGFSFMAPIGSMGARSATNPDYWTFEPDWAISYLANNWVLSANFFYDFNTASGANMGLCALTGKPGICAAQNGFVNGDEFYVDLTALYKVGKWEFGPVAYLEDQTTTDSPGGGITCVASPIPCGMWRNFAVGGLVGYDFGPVDLQVWVTDSIWHQDAIDGFDVWTRLGFRLWGPSAPPALVTKD